MEFTGQENHEITLNDAIQMTTAFQNTNPNMTKASFFGRDAIERILNQEHCVGIRIYGGIDGSEKQSPVLVGVTSSGEDLYEGELAELGGNCPPFCAPNSPLMA